MGSVVPLSPRVLVHDKVAPAGLRTGELPNVKVEPLQVCSVLEPETVRVGVGVTVMVPLALTEPHPPVNGMA